jgi:hypothetical protein
MLGPAHQQSPPSPSRSVESSRPGQRSRRKATLDEGSVSSRDAPNFRANNPLFKERAPGLHVAYRPSGLSPGGRRVSRFMAFHSLRIACVHVVRRYVAPTPRANRLSSDAPFEPLPTGPHERYRLRRPGAPSVVRRYRSRETSFLARARSAVPAWGDHDESEGTRYRSTTSATDVKIEHTRERPVTPRASVETEALANEGCGRQSTGYPAGSRAPALPVALIRPSFGTRLERPARDREGGYPCRARERSKTRRGSESLSAPRPAFDLPRER